MTSDPMPVYNQPALKAEDSVLKKPVLSIALILLVVSSYGQDSCLYGLYRMRIQQIRQEFELRQQISHDLHDTLGARIYLLRAISSKIANPLVPEEDRLNQFNHFEELSQDTFKSIRDFIWAFDPKQDEVAQIPIKRQKTTYKCKFL